MFGCMVCQHVENSKLFLAKIVDMCAVFYLLLATVPAFLSGQVCCLSAHVADAISTEMETYNGFAQYAIQVSMNVSTLAAAMTRQLFEISDDFDNRANILERNLTQLSLSSAKCYRNLNISKAVADMKISVEGTTNCLLNEASKNAKVETDLTRFLNQYQAHSVRGRKAMMRCDLAGPTKIADCLKEISAELRTTKANVWQSIDEIKRRTILRMRGLQIWVGVCTSGAAKAITNVEKKFKMLDTCQQ